MLSRRALDRVVRVLGGGGRGRGARGGSDRPVGGEVVAVTARGGDGWV